MLTAVQVALNEQFMVASLHPNTPQPNSNGFAAQQTDSRTPESSNRVLRVLISRVGSSPTFGENLIFMLNRAERTPEDLCMQLLVLKLLYLLFTTKGMAEFFYTNDLCVLVDVFLREICNIDEENESVSTFRRIDGPQLTCHTCSCGTHIFVSYILSSRRHSCATCPISAHRSCGLSNLSSRTSQYVMWTRR